MNRGIQDSKAVVKMFALSLLLLSQIWSILSGICGNRFGEFPVSLDQNLQNSVHSLNSEQVFHSIQLKICLEFSEWALP